MFAHLRVGAVSGTECRRRSRGRGRRSEQRERGLFRALKMRPVGRCCFWHGTPLKMRPLRQEAVHSLWSRLFCGPLKMRRVPQEAVFGTEYPFCTGKACFCAPSSSENAFRAEKGGFHAPNASENASRTPGSLFEHGTHIPYRRWPSPVPNARQRQVAAAAAQAAISQAR